MRPPSLPTVLAAVVLAALVGCDPASSDPPAAALTGSVSDTEGGTYTGVRVRLDARQTITAANGSFRFDDVSSGDHALDIDLPRATSAVTSLPASVPTVAGTPAQVSVVIAPRPVASHLNLGTIDFLGEIRNGDGTAPTNPSDALYARNVFDAPFGLLTPIETPTGAAVTRAMWETASAEVTTSCDGSTSRVTLRAQGLIAGGTYTVWLNFLNTVRAPGERVDFGNDVVRIEPLGRASGTRNVVVANAAGAVTVAVSHPSCVLTEEAALVMAMLYHLTGTTYGDAHIPDPEEATHLLVYVQ